MKTTGRTPQPPVVIQRRPIRTPEARELAEAFRRQDAEMLKLLDTDYGTLELRVRAAVEKKT